MRNLNPNYRLRRFYLSPTRCQNFYPVSTRWTFYKNTFEKFVALVIWAGSARGKIAHSTCTLLHEFLHVCTFTPTDNRMSILQILRNSKKIINMQEMPSSDKIIWDDKTSSNPDKGIILNIQNNCSQNIF